MGEGLELWLNRYEANLVLKALRDAAESDVIKEDQDLYLELEGRLEDVIEHFDAEQGRRNQ